MTKKDVSNSGPDDQSRNENMDSNMEPNHAEILSYLEESKDQILKEELNRNYAPMLAYIEENIDSIMKEEPNQKTKSAGKEKEKVSKTKVKKFRKRKVWKKIEYIGFASISVFCAFFVMVIWLLSRNDSNKAKETEEVKNETASTSNMCPFWELAGDGYCDDETNIPECGYDYDDCCQPENDRSLCTNCTCHLSEDEVQFFKDQSCNVFPGEITNLLGDGTCDLNLNQEKYFFDVGDCCLEVHDFEAMTCRFEEEDVECPQNVCIPSNNFCIAEELGDGICQDYNNGPYCNYDLGDCCPEENEYLKKRDLPKKSIGKGKEKGSNMKPEKLQDCCGCFCHQVSHDEHHFYFG